MASLRISLTNKIRLAAIPILVALFAMPWLIIHNMKKDAASYYTSRQAEVYIEQLASILDLIRTEGYSGFTAADQVSARPYFRRPAFAQSDFPFIASKQGTYLVHTLREGQMLPLELQAAFKTTRQLRGAFTHTERHGSKVEQRVTYYRYYDPYDAYIGISILPTEQQPQHKRLVVLIIVAALAVAIFLAFILYSIIFPLKQRIQGITHAFDQFAQGSIPEPLPMVNDVTDRIAAAINLHAEQLAKTAEFSASIGTGSNATTDYQPMGPNDTLGHALIDLYSSLAKQHEAEVQRKLDDEIRTWTNIGVAKFAEILQRNSDDVVALGDDIIQNLVSYLNINQGGLFTIVQAEDGSQRLELLAAFAYNRKKYIHNTIELGEGLVGTCAIERQTIYLTEIPQDYISITSGLGETTPSCLLLVPLKINNNVLGVVELASLTPMKPHEIDFVEKIGVNIATTINSTQENLRTKRLLEQSQQQREQMSAQEEEMRQNMEEMQATQEEMARKQTELEGMTNAINAGFAFAQLNDDGLIMNPNHNLLALIGKSIDEVDGQLLFDLIDSEQLTDFRSQWKQVLLGETIETSLTLNANDVPIAFTIAPGFDDAGALSKIYMIGHGVAAVPMMSAAPIPSSSPVVSPLSQEHQHLLYALDKDCLISLIEPSGKIRYINQKNVDTLGGAKTAIEGRFIQDIDYTARREPEVFHKMWNDLRLGIPHQRFLKLMVDEQMVVIQEYYTPIMDNNDTLTLIINIGFDVTQTISNSDSKGE